MALGTYQVVLILAGVFALKDLVLNDLGKKVAEDDVDTTLGSTLTSPRRNGPSVKFLYCSSWGYHGAYEQFGRILLERYPELYVEGDNYPPAMWKRVCAQIVSAVKFVVLGSVIFNQLWILQLVNIPQNTLNWITQNKIYACLMTFFLGNFVETQLLSTGAFEIYVNDIQVWSKLRTGRVPAPGELMSIISSQLKNTGAGITAEDMML